MPVIRVLGELLAFNKVKYTAPVALYLPSTIVLHRIPWIYNYIRHMTLQLILK